MKAIWKYKIEITDKQTIEIPEGYEILTVQKQRDDVCLWAIVEKEKDCVPVEIYIYGTGHNIPDGHGKYIGTIQLHGGSLVFHTFYHQFGVTP